MVTIIPYNEQWCIAGRTLLVCRILNLNININHWSFNLYAGSRTRPINLGLELLTAPPFALNFGPVWITMQLQKSRLFDNPIEAGWTYSKPLKFLSIALVESGLDWNEINKKITDAVEIKARRSGLVSGTPPGQQAVTDQQVISRRRAFIGTMKEVSNSDVIGLEGLWSGFGWIGSMSSVDWIDSFWRLLERQWLYPNLESIGLS